MRKNGIIFGEHVNMGFIVGRSLSLSIRLYRSLVCSTLRMCDFAAAMPPLQKMKPK